jgi:hypothetical protein
MIRAVKTTSKMQPMKVPAGVFEIIRKEAANPGKNVHIISSGKKWAVKMAGTSRAIKIYNTKEEALHRAKKLVKSGRAEMIINHKYDGSFTIVR